MAEDINLKRDEATGLLLSPERTKIVKQVERDDQGRIASVLEETLPATASPAEIHKAVKAAASAQAVAMGVDVIQKAVDEAVRAVRVSAERAATSSSAMLKDALDKTLEATKAQAAAEDAERDAKPSFTPAAEMSPRGRSEAQERYRRMVAGEMSPKARAEAEERYRRMVTAQEDDVDEETITALEYVIDEIDHAVRALAKSFGMPMHEVTEDLGPPRKRTRPSTTTHPAVLDDRPEFRFPDSSDMGRAASESSAEEEEADDEDAGKQRRHKSRHRAVSKRHLGPIMGPSRWQR
jgi:hypothetical protein